VQGPGLPPPENLHPASKQLGLLIAKPIDRVSLFVREQNVSAIPGTSSVESDAEVYSAGINIVSPKEIETLADLCDIRMSHRVSSNEGIGRIPSAVEIIGHDVKPIDYRVDRNDIEIPHVPV